MNNSRLIIMLRTFSKGELKEFGKLVSSPFFNKGRNYLPFLKELEKFYPKFEDEKMTYEHIYRKVYPGKKFNKQIIWNITSSLLNMAEEFLVYISLKKNAFIRDSQIIDELLERKEARIYSKKLDDMQKTLDKSGMTGSYFFFKAQLEAGKIQYRFLEDEQHLIPPNMVKKGEYAILDFLRNISGIINDMRSNTKMFNAVFDVNIPYEFISNLNLENIVNYAKSNRFAYKSIIEMYYCSIITALKPEESKHFFRFKELYGKNAWKFDAEEKRVWLTLLSNYCSDRINEGDDSFRKILFEVNQLHLKEVERSQKLEMGKILYLQTLRNALSINEVKWAKAYIEKYTNFLKPSYQKSMRAMANSFLFFKLKDYNKVIENLGKVRFIDIRDKLFAKNLYIRAYYELKEFPTLHYQIDSTKQFINKNVNIARHTRKSFNT